MDNKKQKEQFEQEITQTTQVEKENRQAEQNKKAEEIFNSRQEVYITGIGQLVFDYPRVGLTLEGDLAAARFKSAHLKMGDLLTEQQLKALYSKPTTVEIEGKTITVGDGSWTEKQDNELEELPTVIKSYRESFEDFRAMYQETNEQIMAIPEVEENKERIEELKRKRDNYFDSAQQTYTKMLELQMELLELQTLRMSLFSISLEEMSNLEKLKIYVPECIKIKENGTIRPLWKDLSEAMNSGLEFIRVISLFNLFLRGADVSFFGNIPEDQTIS